MKAFWVIIITRVGEKTFLFYYYLKFSAINFSKKEISLQFGCVDEGKNYLKFGTFQLVISNTYMTLFNISFH